MAQDYVSPQEALWTFNVSSRTWRQQFASGVLLEPVTACGLAVANGRAYLLSFSHEREGVMEIYKLNLDTWRWRLLPRAGVIPPPAFGEPLKVQVHTFSMALRAESPETTDCVPLHGAQNRLCCLSKLLPPLACNWEGAWTQHCLFNKLLGQLAQGYVCVWGQCAELKDDLQNQWLFHTGEHSCCGIYIFDFATLSWSKPEVTGKPLRPCSCYLATCHEDSTIMMGGNASACSSQLQLRRHLWF